MKARCLVRHPNSGSVIVECTRPENHQGRHVRARDPNTVPVVGEAADVRRHRYIAGAWFNEKENTR